MAERFDLVTIGGGSGGLAAAQRAAAYGARVALVEGGRLGGTCVNVGCVPKKVMWHAASLGHELAAARGYGWNLDPSGQRHDWGALKARRDSYIERLNGIYARNLERKGITRIQGWASLAGPGRVRAGSLELEAPHVIIATGGRPAVPAVPGAELGLVSDDFFTLPARPQRVAIVGSGYIAVEFAGVLRALGSDVTLIARRDSVLRSFDPMLQQGLIDALTRDGIVLEFNCAVSALRQEKTGIRAQTADGSGIGPFDAVFWTVGREPNTDGLELATAGVEVDGAGHIRTDGYQCTTQPGIYAIGDVTGREPLTPVAIAAGRRLADRLFGGQQGRCLDYANIPTVIFTHPPIGTCGLPEPAARERWGDDVRIYTASFVPLYYGVLDEKPRAHMKLVTRGPEEVVVGCHIIGPGADEMLQGFAVAIRMGARKADLDDTVAIHPTAAEELVTMR
ncbi:MAG: glutathione-disulfide reductase [Chromatiales bacterium]|nr:glutathione-disulfide reductase [Chromatiales bacterium]